MCGTTDTGLISFLLAFVNVFRTVYDVFAHLFGMYLSLTVGFCWFRCGAISKCRLASSLKFDLHVSETWIMRGNAEFVQFLSARKCIQRERTFGRYVGYYLHVKSYLGSGTYTEVERSDIHPEFLCETCKRLQAVHVSRDV